MLLRPVILALTSVMGPAPFSTSESIDVWSLASSRTATTAVAPMLKKILAHELDQAQSNPHETRLSVAHIIKVTIPFLMTLEPGSKNPLIARSKVKALILARSSIETGVL